jgi:hypothetical protein
MDSGSSSRSVPSLGYGRRSPAAPVMNTKTPARKQRGSDASGRRSAFIPLSSEAHEVRYMARRCPLWSPGTEDEVRLMFVGELRSSGGPHRGLASLCERRDKDGVRPNPLARR